MFNEMQSTPAASAVEAAGEDGDFEGKRGRRHMNKVFIRFMDGSKREIRYVHHISVNLEEYRLVFCAGFIKTIFKGGNKRNGLTSAI